MPQYHSPPLVSDKVYSVKSTSQAKLLIHLSYSHSVGITPTASCAQHSPLPLQEGVGDPHTATLAWTSWDIHQAHPAKVCPAGVLAQCACCLNAGLSAGGIDKGGDAVLMSRG